MRVSVAERRHGDAGREIEVAPPVGGEQISPFPALEGEIRPGIGGKNRRNHKNLLAAPTVGTPDGNAGLVRVLRKGGSIGATPGPVNAAGAAGSPESSGNPPLKPAAALSEHTFGRWLSARP
jgi:hypothetical protein